MTAPELKAKILAQFDKSIIEKLPAHLSAVIDENVESFLEGRIKVDGKVPETEEEIINVLNHGGMSNIMGGQPL